MVANFVGDLVGLREFCRYAKAFLELLKEAEVEVNLLVFRTGEGTDGCLGQQAKRIHHARAILSRSRLW